MNPTAWQSVDLDARLAWANRWMTHTKAAGQALPRLDDVRLAVTSHLDLKAFVMLSALLDAGAAMMVHEADPATTHTNIVGLLGDCGVTVGSVGECVDWEPTHTVEMGGDIVVEAATRGYDGIVAGVETTRTGLSRISALTLAHPVFDADALPLKNHLHNRFAVGSSTWQTVLSRTNLSLHGLVVVVVGYGEVGGGLARSARGHGAQVLVAEVDPARATIATYDGFETGQLAELAARADVIVTATGRPGAVPALPNFKPGCLLVNAGHSPDEIDLPALGPATRVIPAVTSHQVNGREVLLFADGHVANLAAGDGDSLNAFDLTAAVIVNSTAWMIANGHNYPPGLHPLPH
ncbi:NAD(P)-dependent oxidoreductase [Kribbella deserti]|uniref:NAD(P)-dependent oxidoreductase n=1 Tax=Kribbella deserti TaxID=1926257 RepID=A0ABV6QJF5_9ACTN